MPYYAESQVAAKIDRGLGRDDILKSGDVNGRASSDIDAAAGFRGQHDNELIAP